MSYIQQELPLGRFGSLGPVTAGERFFVPDRWASLRVSEMSPNDVLSAADFCWSEDNGVVGQALQGLWEVAHLSVPLEAYNSTKVAQLVPWFFEAPRWQSPN